MRHIAFEQNIPADCPPPEEFQRLCHRDFEGECLRVGDLPDVQRGALLALAERAGVDRAVAINAPARVQLWWQGRGDIGADGRLIPADDGPSRWTFRFRCELQGDA